MDEKLHPLFDMDLIIYPCPDVDGTLAKLPLKLGYGWVIAYHTSWESWGRHFVPKQVGVRGPWGEFSPQPEYPRSEF